ncbi:MAG: M48 family metallopeptidase [Spirochaetales bacterium]|nr:M48 family metallopeptidase [Spirochaetales bacterium]
MQRTPLKELTVFAIIVATSILIALGVVYLLPGGNSDSGQDADGSGLDSISISLENNLKELIKAQIDAENRYLTHPRVIGAITEIKDRFLPLIENNPFEVDILVIESPTVNAMAFPGGLVIIYSGLIKYTDSAEELAGIIAHELGHVVHRDSMNLLVRSFTVSFLINVVSGGRSPELANEIIRDLINSSYSREQEQSADSFAFELLTDAGINPLHLAHMFEKFEKITGPDRGLLKYISTHPSLDSRRKKALESALEFSNTHPEENKFNSDWSQVKKALPSVLDQ